MIEPRKEPKIRVEVRSVRGIPIQMETTNPVVRDSLFGTTQTRRATAGWLILIVSRTAQASSPTEETATDDFDNPDRQCIESGRISCIERAAVGVSIRLFGGGDQGVAGQELLGTGVIVAGAQVVAARFAVQVLPGVAQRVEEALVGPGLDAYLVHSIDNKIIVIIRVAAFHSCSVIVGNTAATSAGTPISSTAFMISDRLISLPLIFKP